MDEDFGFGDEGLGFRDEGLGFRVHGTVHVIQRMRNRPCETVDDAVLT